MDTDLLTERERVLIADLGIWWEEFMVVVGMGPTRSGDCDEAIHHVHALQRAVMSQAAGRAYPTLFRLLGETVTGDVGAA
jgi:hypothetical protein